jgi:hypothetical protein
MPLQNDTPPEDSELPPRVQAELLRCAALARAVRGFIDEGTMETADFAQVLAIELADRLWELYAFPSKFTSETGATPE